MASAMSPCSLHDKLGSIQSRIWGNPLQSLRRTSCNSSSPRTAQATLSSESTDRDTRTPHSGYHFDGSSRRFFEGWYFKVSIPQEKQSFAWMYSAEDLGFASSKESKALGVFASGTRFPGVGAQVLGADDEYLCQHKSDVTDFWGSRHELALGCTFIGKKGESPPKSEVPRAEFWDRIEEGYQVTPTWHQGFLRDDGRNTFVKTVVDTVRWEYSTRPIYGWGDQGSLQKATAGWLAAFPVFEPHWQVCMAGGLSSGWIEWGDRRFEFENAPSYSEKNWGGSFPLKWFWVQCNVFDGVSGEVALTAGGGKRGLPLIPGATEEIAMIGVHYAGKHYEFVPWAGEVDWNIGTWGSWEMSARNDQFEVQLKAVTEREGTILRAPTSDAGFAPVCRDTFVGNLHIQIWERIQGRRGKVVLDATSDMAALEVGGGPWYTSWKSVSKLQDPVRGLIGLPINVEDLFRPAPILKPPGL